MTENTPGNVVNCPESLTIAMVSTLHAELQHTIQGNKDIVLNGDAVAAADTAGLQLLCALFLDAQANHVNLAWQSASDTLRQNAQIIGADRILGLDKLN